MIDKIIGTVVTFVISGVLGYTISLVKNYKSQLSRKKENEVLQNRALLTLLRNNLTSTYFIYSEVKEIPDYVYQNFLSQLEVYELLGGDGFIHTIAKKIETWEIVKTDIL